MAFQLHFTPFPFVTSEFNMIEKMNACAWILLGCLILFPGPIHATLIDDEVFLNRHWQLTNGTDYYARPTALSALVTDGLGPEFNDFGSWRVNLHIDIEESSIEISEQGYTWGGDGYISVFSHRNNFHRLEITDLNFADPALGIVGVTLNSVDGTTPVTPDDLTFGTDYLYVDIGGTWSDASRIVIDLETEAITGPDINSSTNIPEPSSLSLILIGMLIMVPIWLKRKGKRENPVLLSNPQQLP